MVTNHTTNHRTDQSVPLYACRVAAWMTKESDEGSPTEIGTTQSVNTGRGDRQPFDGRRGCWIAGVIMPSPIQERQLRIMPVPMRKRTTERHASRALYGPPLLAVAAVRSAFRMPPSP
jgi:hypothetical protein